MQIRRTREEDIPRLKEIFDGAKKRMAEGGNPNQWVGDYPAVELLRSDMARNASYVVEDGGEIVGTFMFFTGIEPFYEKLISGKWINEDPYGTIHRIASDGKTHGLLKTVVEYCRPICANLRLDTHPDNIPMQRAAESAGFKSCCVIPVESDGSTRIGYVGDFRGE